MKTTIDGHEIIITRNVVRIDRMVACCMMKEYLERGKAWGLLFHIMESTGLFREEYNVFNPLDDYDALYDVFGDGFESAFMKGGFYKHDCSVGGKPIVQLGQ